MSYSVEYNPEMRISYPINSKRLKPGVIKHIILVVGIMIVLFVLNASGWLSTFLPGDRAVTAGAFSTMVEQAQAGNSFYEVVFAFFKEVIVGGMQS